MPRRAKQFTPSGPGPDWNDPRTIDAVAQLELVQRETARRYVNDPYLFLVECVQTLDQAKQAIRPFPDKEYLRYLTALWLKEPQLLVEKSRRMIVTWVMVALHYWMFRFRPGSKIGFMARKEGKSESEGSAELVWRAWFIHQHLPPVLPPLDVEYHFCRLYSPSTHAEIIGLGEGADQARQHTFSAVFADEMGFWTWARETYNALRPTLEGGGRLTCVSTANPGFFDTLVHDQLNVGGAFA